MQYIQEISLDIHQHGYVSINAKQGDQNGRFIRIHLTDNSKEIKLENGETVEFRALKPDGKSVDNPATIEEGGTILACLTDQTLAVAGEVLADIAIKQGADVVSTLNFIVDVQKAPLGEDIPSTNEFGTLTKATEDAVSATNRANDAAGLIEGMTVSASKVAAGGTPTAKLTTDGDHYNLALGLVTGDKGAKGDKGDTPTIEIADTVTGAPGDPAKVENVGTATDPKLKFTIPLGNQGPVSSVNGGTRDVVIGGRNYLLLTGSIKAELTGTGKSQDVYVGFDTSLSLDELLAGQYVLSADCVLKDAVGEQGASMPPRAYLYVVAYYADGISHELFSSTETFTYGQGSVTKNTKMVVNMDFAPYLSNGITSVLIRATIQRLVSGYACISRVKLEVGNVATDWTPAPEDKADVPQQFDIKLPASGWASGSQTVTDARFITGDNIDWDVDVKGACIPWDGITITDGQMVAKADIVPTADMTWTVTRQEVRRDG